MRAKTHLKRWDREKEATNKQQTQTHTHSLEPMMNVVKSFIESTERLKALRNLHSKQIAQWKFHSLFSFSPDPSHSFYCQLFANLPKWFILGWGGVVAMNRNGSESSEMWWMNYRFSFGLRARWEDARDTPKPCGKYSNMMQTYLNLWEFRSPFAAPSTRPSGACHARAPYRNQLICLTVYHLPMFLPLLALLWASSIRN